MAKAVRGQDFDPYTEPIDGETVMRMGGGKKHGRYVMAGSVIDTASTPTLAQLRARQTDSTPPIRPRRSPVQIEMEQFKVISVALVVQALYTCQLLILTHASYFVGPDGGAGTGDGAGAVAGPDRED